jgi:FixJ family two-component response regulator
VLDVNLRGETSEAVAQRLSETGRPFVAVSGYARNQQPEALLAGEFLAKPVDHARLIEALQRMTQAEAGGRAEA